MIYDTNLEQCAEVCNLGLTKVMEHCYTYAVQGLVTYTYTLNCRLSLSHYSMITDEFCLYGMISVNKKQNYNIENRDFLSRP